MKVAIPYEESEITINIPDAQLMGVFPPNNVNIRDPKDVLHQALSQPHGNITFDEFLDDASELLFLVNDGTRPTPTGQVLQAIYEQIKDRDVTFLVATGCHRPPTEQEIQRILGPTYDAFRHTILAHDAYQSPMHSLGTSTYGTEIYINELAIKAEKIIVIGSVEPHYFAGYTGGRKAFLPGIAAFKTIEQNHKFALHPEARALALQGNPVHEDMKDALTNFERSKVFSIQTVLDKERRIYAATAGDIDDSFYAAIDKAHEVFCVEPTAPADIVISVAPYPMDIDLYQSQKAIENAKLAMKPGGILILVSACRDGIGKDTFYKLLKMSPNRQEILDHIQQGYKLGYHKAAKILELTVESQIWVVSDLAPNLLDDVFMSSFDSVQTALDQAIAQKGDNAKVLVFPEGSITVPKFRDDVALPKP